MEGRLFPMFTLAEAAPARRFTGAERCGGGPKSRRGGITDSKIADGNYCYSTIKLYIVVGITSDRADRGGAADV